MTDEVIARVAAITETNDHGTYNPWHDMVDHAKCDLLIASMTEDGWRGAPLVVDGGNALTGSHRLAAQNRLWNEHGINVPIPYVEVSDLCEEFGLDWAALLDEHSTLIRDGNEYADEQRDYDTVAAAIALAERLPVEVVDYVGLDIH